MRRIVKRQSGDGAWLDHLEMHVLLGDPFSSRQRPQLHCPSFPPSGHPLSATSATGRGGHTMSQLELIRSGNHDCRRWVDSFLDILLIYPMLQIGIDHELVRCVDCLVQLDIVVCLLTISASCGRISTGPPGLQTLDNTAQIAHRLTCLRDPSTPSNILCRGGRLSGMS